MRKTVSLDQVCPTGAYAPGRTPNLQNKSKFRGSILGELINFASSVPDFRRSCKGNIRHRLADIIMLMILGRASGHVARSEIIEFGRHNLNRFRKMGMLRNGVPSEATLCRVEHGIDELSMADRMREFALQTLSSRIVSYIEHNGAIDNLQEAAFILGVARPSLSRAVAQLVSQGVLRKSDKGYVTG